MRDPDIRVTERRLDVPHLAKAGRVLSIAAQAFLIAHALDVENGDATPTQAPGWYHQARAHAPNFKPWFYANRSTMPALISALQHAGIARSEYRLWLADPDGVDRLVPGFDAKQYLWTQGWDRSIFPDDFLEAVAPKPKPQPKPIKRPWTPWRRGFQTGFHEGFHAGWQARAA